jgi:GntR family transcriptional regulator, transcriptional repressor for pyruvate dehydrogenase complex
MADTRVPAVPTVMQADGGMFSPVSTGRVSEIIVEQIRELIRQGQLPPGSRLPAERELCERFGVSRVTVREALRVLEATGLVVIRIGARGGAFVTSPSADRVGEGITDLMTMSALSAVDVTEARRILEIGVIPLACERADEADLAALTELCDLAERAVQDGVYTNSMSSEFHGRLADSAHNGAISLLSQSFRGPTLMSLEEAHSGAPMGLTGINEHRALVEAIRARDVGRATSIMAEHLDRTATRVAEPASPPARRGRKPAAKAR